MGRKEQKEESVGHRRRARQNSNSGFILAEFDEVTNAKSSLNNVGLAFMRGNGDSPVRVSWKSRKGVRDLFYPNAEGSWICCPSRL